MKPLAPKSWMFVPASVPRVVEKAFASATEAVILDLEDAVADPLKDQARESLAAVQPHADKQIWVRVNSRHTQWRKADIEAVAFNTAIDGVLLPKVEGPEDLLTPEQLSAAGRETPLKQGVLMESALGVLALQGLFASGVRIDMVMFGGAEAGDLMTDLQCAWTPQGIEMLHARQHVLLCARAYPPCQPVDGVFVNLDDNEALVQETQLSRSFGFRSRAAIHPKQLEAINTTYAPTADELERAARVVEEFEIALQGGRAAVQVAGKLIDYAMYRAACRVLNIVEISRRDQ